MSEQKKPAANQNSDPEPEAGEFTESTRQLKVDQETFNRELKKAKDHPPCMIIVRGTPQGHPHFLTTEETVFGRDPNADIQLHDTSISRKHIQIIKRGEEVFVMDLGSSNGTQINDNKIPAKVPVKLARADMIKLGETILKFLPAGEVEVNFWQEAEDKGYTDGLTKISNKRHLMAMLDSEFKRAKALHTDLCIVMFDIDFFKKVNDTYGHDAGDYVLREMCGIIRSNHVRGKDVFARYGGEEFSLLLTNTNAEEGNKIAESIRLTVEAHTFIHDGKRLPITISMGVKELDTGVSTPDTLLKHADNALYAAKKGGRNRVVVSS